MSSYRSRPHRVRPYIAVYKPPVVLACQVNNVSAARGDRVLPYDSVTQGNYSGVLADITMYVGTTPGSADKGRIRVRSATATEITVAENDHILWSDNLYLTVVKFWEPWGVYPFIELVNDTPVFYKDRDISYTGQNTNMDPIVNMGYHLAMFEHDEAKWTSSGSFSPVGASLNAYDWTFEGGVPTGSTQAHPGMVNYPAAGNFTASLAVTDSNGAQYTGYRHVMVYPRPHATFGHWGLTSLEGDREGGGYTAQIWVREEAALDVIVDGALVVIFAEQWFGDGTYEPHAVRFVGYIQDESIRYDALTSLVNFTVKSVTGTAAGRDTFSLALDSKASPADWTQMPDVTVDKALIHYMRWHTTLLRLTDFYPTNDDRLIQFADFTRGPIYNTLKQFLSTAVLANLTANARGQMFAEIDANYLLTGSSRNFDVLMDVERSDWMNEPSITRVQFPRVSYIELGGVGYSGDATGTFGAWLSGAPGEVPAYFGSAQRLTGLAIDGQDDLNRLSGLYYGNLVNEFPEATFQLAGNYDFVDIAPQKRVRITLQATDTFRRLVWNAKRFLVQRVSWNFDHQQQVALPEVSLKAETESPTGAGITIVIPTEPPYNPPSYQFRPFPTFQPIPPKKVTTGGDGNTVYAMSLLRLRGTVNFQSASPNWTDKRGNLVITGDEHFFDLVLDPFDPIHKAYVIVAPHVLSPREVWSTTNLNAATPTWSKLLTEGDLVGGIAVPVLKWLKGSLASSGYIAVACRRRLVHSHDRGLTWSISNLLGLNDQNALTAFEVAQASLGRVWLTAASNVLGSAAHIYVSSDHGHTFIIGALGGQLNPFQNNEFSTACNPQGTGVLYLMGGYQYFTGGTMEAYVRRYDDGGVANPGVPVDVTPTFVHGWGDGGDLWNSGGPRSLVAYPPNPSVLAGIFAQSKDLHGYESPHFFYTENAGASWTLKKRFDQSAGNLVGWPFNSNWYFICGGVGGVSFTQDAGLTWESKSGDWPSGGPGPGVIAPVWVKTS